MRNLVNIQSDTFIVDHACKTMQKANKTGAQLRKLACLELRPRAGLVCTILPTWRPIKSNIYIASGATLQHIGDYI